MRVGARPPLVVGVGELLQGRAFDDLSTAQRKTRPGQWPHAKSSEQEIESKAFIYSGAILCSGTLSLRSAVVLKSRAPRVPRSC